MNKFEFELVFSVPAEGSEDPLDYANAVFEAGFEDSVVGLGRRGLVGVSLEHEGDTAEEAILDAAHKILEHLPVGSVLREVRPDLVSLADVAARLKISRQALQKRKMPLPAVGSLYRASEIFEVIIQHQVETYEKVGKSHTTMSSRLPESLHWFNAAPGAQLVNAKIALGQNPFQRIVTKKARTQNRNHVTSG